jgi:hypothetical protein
MRACAVNYELLTVIRNSHAEVIGNCLVKVETRSPTKRGSQFFAYKLFS